MRNLIRVFLIGAVVISIADARAEKGTTPSNYRAIVLDHEGFPNRDFKDPFEVEFFATRNSDKDSKLPRVNAAQWRYLPQGVCVGHIRLPEKSDVRAWAEGAKGKFDIMCPDSFTAEGELTSEGDADPEYLGVWIGKGKAGRPPHPLTDEEVAAGVKSSMDVSFTLKVRK